MNLWRCPNAKAFIEEVCEIVRLKDKHVCLVLPQNLIHDFESEFTRLALNYLGNIWTVWVDQPSKLEATFLEEAFETQDLTLDKALDENAKNMYLLLIVDTKEPDLEQSLLKFQTKLAELAKIRKDGNGTLLWRVILLCPAQLPWPKSEVCLELKFWWGQIYQSDIEYAIERCADELYHGTLKEYEYLWLYSLCQGLAPIDPMLSETIFKALPINLEQIQALLKNYLDCSLDGETKSLIIQMDKQPTRLARDHPPEGLERKLWSLGLLDIKPDGLTSLHPWAIQAANRVSSLERLIVQGQIKVFLPLVQEVHSFISTKLKKYCGDTWNKKDASFQSINDEIGGLPRYMSEYLKGKHDPRLYDLANHWRNIRNFLAHGHMIECADAIAAYKLYYNLREILE